MLYINDDQCVVKLIAALEDSYDVISIDDYCSKKMYNKLITLSNKQTNNKLKVFVLKQLFKIDKFKLSAENPNCLETSDMVGRMKAYLGEIGPLSEACDIGYVLGVFPNEIEDVDVDSATLKTTCREFLFDYSELLQNYDMKKTRYVSAFTRSDIRGSAYVGLKSSEVKSFSGLKTKLSELITDRNKQCQNNTHHNT